MKLNQAETASSGSAGGVRKSSGNGNGSPEIVSKRNKKIKSNGLVDQIEKARVEGKSKGKGKQRQSATSTLTTTLDQDREKDKEMESPTKKSRSNTEDSQDLNRSPDSRRVKEKSERGSSSYNNTNSSNPNREAINKSSNSSINRSISFHNDLSFSSSSTSSTSNLNSNHKRIKRTSSSPSKLRGRFKRSRTSNSISIPGVRSRRVSSRNDGDMSLDGEDVGNQSSSGSGNGNGNGGEELVMKLLADLNEQLNSFGEVGSQEDQAPDQDQDQVGALEDKNNGLCGSQPGKLFTESQEIQMKEIEITTKAQVQGSENKKARDVDLDRGKENSSQTLIPQITSEHSTKKSHSLSSNRQFGRTTSLPSKSSSSRSNNNQVQLNSSSTITDTSGKEQSKVQVEIKSKKEGMVRKLPLQTIRSENDVFNSSPIRRNGDNKNVKKSPKIERLRNRGNDEGDDSDEFDLSLDLDFETQMELDRLEMVEESQKLRLASQRLDDQIQVLGGEKMEVDDDDEEEQEEEEVQVVKEKVKEKEKEIEMKIEKVDQLKEETSKEIVSTTAAASNEEISTKIEKNSNSQVPQSTSPSKIKSSTSSSIASKTTINRKASVQTSTSNPTASKPSQPQPISGKVIYSRKSPLPPRAYSNWNKDKEKGPKTGLNKAFKPPRRVGPVQNLNASGNSNPKERSNSNVSSSSNPQRRVSGNGNGNGLNSNLKMKGGSGSSISKAIVLDDDEEEGKGIKSRKSPRLNRKRNEMLEKSDESFDFDDGVGDEEVEKIFREQGC